MAKVDFFLLVPPHESYVYRCRGRCVDTRLLHLSAYPTATFASIHGLLIISGNLSEALTAEHSIPLSIGKSHPYIAELNQPQWGLSGLFSFFPKLGALFFLHQSSIPSK